MVVSIIDKNTVRKKNGSAGWKKGSILHRVVWMKPSEENSWAKTWRRWGGSEPYGGLREEETIGRKSLNLECACLRNSKEATVAEAEKTKRGEKACRASWWAILSIKDFTESDVRDNWRILTKSLTSWQGFKRTTLASRLDRGNDKKTS